MKCAIISGLLLLLLPFTAAAQPTASPPAAEKAGVRSAFGASPTTREFVHEVAIRDMFEIRASELAKAKAGGAITSFADRVLSDHQKLASELRALVQNGTVNAALPGSLDIARQSKLDRLASLSQAEFVRAYNEDQVAAHASAVGLFERYAKGGDNAALRDWAVTTLPTLKSHLKMAQDLN